MKIRQQDIVSIDIDAVNQLTSLLNDNNQMEKAQAMQDLVKNFAFVEDSLNTAMAELQAIKKQLNLDMVNTTIQPSNKALKTQVSVMENSFQKMKEQFNDIKENLISTVQNLVDDVKENGVLALDKTSQFILLKDNLTAFHNSVKNNITNINKTIKTVNAITQEFNAAVKHTKNIGRVIRGKERDSEMNVPSETAVKPLKAMKKVMIGIEGKTGSAIGTVEKLSAYADLIKEKKPSVLKQLKEEKENIVTANPPNTKDKEMAI
ncbi:MAG: DUF6674 family protein [Anaerotignaceae bacterium]